MMKTSNTGLAQIAAHEGIVLGRYRDSVGVWTVGIGHTASAGAPDPAHERRSFGLDEVMTIFRRDIARFEARVEKAFTRPLTQEQFDAAVSFDFNTGGIHRATWVRRFNAGDDAAARLSFMAWRKPPEIIPRRGKEHALFFEGRYGDSLIPIYETTPSGRVHKTPVRRIRDHALFPTPPSRSSISATAVATIVAAILAALGAAFVWLKRKLS